MFMLTFVRYSIFYMHVMFISLAGNYNSLQCRCEEFMIVLIVYMRGYVNSHHDCASVKVELCIS